jgi:anaerobic ribonucleoside-triphosphate reductase activating protein
MTVEEVAKSLSTSTNNVTISGGEPMWQFDEMIELVYALANQGKTCWLYTGFQYASVDWRTWWQLHAAGVIVVIDGRFDERLKDSSLLFRGSANQRIIDLEKTLNANEVVLWEEET